MQIELKDQSPSLVISNKEMFAATHVSQPVSLFLKTMDQQEEEINAQETANYQPKWYHKCHAMLLPSAAGTGTTGVIGLTNCCGLVMPLLWGLSAGICTFIVIKTLSMKTSPPEHIGQITDPNCFNLYFTRAQRLEIKIKSLQAEIKKLQGNQSTPLNLAAERKIQSNPDIKALSNVCEVFQTILMRYVNNLDILTQ